MRALGQPETFLAAQSLKSGKDRPGRHDLFMPGPLSLEGEVLSVTRQELCGEAQPTDGAYEVTPLPGVQIPFKDML